MSFRQNMTLHNSTNVWKPVGAACQVNAVKVWHTEVVRPKFGLQSLRLATLWVTKISKDNLERIFGTPSCRSCLHLNRFSLEWQILNHRCKANEGAKSAIQSMWCKVPHWQGRLAKSPCFQKEIVTEYNTIYWWQLRSVGANRRGSALPISLSFKPVLQCLNEHQTERGADVVTHNFSSSGNFATKSKTALLHMFGCTFYWAKLPTVAGRRPSFESLCCTWV